MVMLQLGFLVRHNETHCLSEMSHDKNAHNLFTPLKEELNQERRAGVIHAAIFDCYPYPETNPKP